MDLIVKILMIPVTLYLIINFRLLSTMFLRLVIIAFILLIFLIEEKEGIDLNLFKVCLFI